jgi:hypothetical protein
MPGARYAHPEFGLLCPTPRLRRKLRVGSACLIFALIAGAVFRASNIPPSADSWSADSWSADSWSADPSSAITTAHRDEGAAASADAGQLPAATLATRPSLPAIAETRPVRNDCAEGSALRRTWAYLDGKCDGGKARKPRTVRVETDRPPIAAIAIGRIAAPERVPEPVSAVPSVPTGPQANPPKSAAAASAEMAATTEPPSRLAAASKKPQKTARSHQRRREPTGTDAVWWREVRADDAGARGYGERDYGRGGYAREGAFGLGYGQRDYGRAGYARDGAFGFFR